MMENHNEEGTKLNTRAFVYIIDTFSFVSEREYSKPSSKASNVLPLWGNERTMNLNPLILTNIQSSHYFKGMYCSDWVSLALMIRARYSKKKTILTHTHTTHN